MNNKFFKLLTSKPVLIFFELLLVLSTIYVFSLVKKANWKAEWEFADSDLTHEFKAAMEVKKGINPYKRILGGDLLVNQKYATFMPLYYYTLIFVDSFSNNDYDRFLEIYRDMLSCAQVLTGLLFYIYFRGKKNRLMGFAAMLFFLFNRWTINILSDGKSDSLAMCALVASLFLYKSHFRLSFFLFGVSLGMKHIGIFLSPIYALPIIFRTRSVKEYLIDVLVFCIPTLLPALHFILNSPLSFFYSMLFNITRQHYTTSVSFGFEKLLVLYDVGVKNNSLLFYILPRLPLIILTGINVLLLFLKKTKISWYALASIFIFVAVNPVLIDQYMTWITPMLFISFLDLDKHKLEIN